MFTIQFSKLNQQQLLQMALQQLGSTLELWERHIWETVATLCNDELNFIEVQTSGSTGTPKKVKHNKQHVFASAELTCKALLLNRADTALLCLPANKIGGIMMIARSLYNQMDLVCIEPNSSPLAETEMPGKLAFAAFTPMQFYGITHSPEQFARATQIDKIILGGQAVSTSLLQFIKAMPNEVYSTYGMTETISHIALQKISGNNAQSFYQTLPGITLTTDSRNCLIIRAPQLGQANLITNDVVNLLSPTRFEWLGRYDNVINSGGIKIYPEEIERLLEPNLPQQFFIAGMEDEKLGQKVVLFVEATELTGAGIQQIIEVINQLDKLQRPKEIGLIKSFIITETGKVNRKVSAQNAEDFIPVKL